MISVFISRNVVEIIYTPISKNVNKRDRIECLFFNANLPTKGIPPSPVLATQHKLHRDRQRPLL